MTRPNGNLRVPDAERVQYERNFIQLAVCELKFPTVLEIEKECPLSFQKALRRHYPHLEQGASINLLLTGGQSSEKRYTFRSFKKKWSVSLRSSAFALETIAYENFEDFLDKLKWVVEQAASIIDSDFFTRVGLRYGNLLPVKGDPTEWLNPDLVKPLIDNILGLPSKYWQTVSGTTDFGNFNLNHGFEDGDSDERSYVLDFDFYRELVKIEELEKLLVDFNCQNFKLFNWAIGPKAIEYLGAATKKAPRG